MAKKNLASLMSGIMSDETPANVPVEVASTPEVTDEMRDNLEARRKKNVGRPRKDEVVVRPNEIRATFIVDPELVRKVKYISLVEGNLLKDVINSALRNYINAWEEENVKIRIPKKR